MITIMITMKLTIMNTIDYNHHLRHTHIMISIMLFRVCNYN